MKTFGIGDTVILYFLVKNEESLVSATITLKVSEVVTTKSCYVSVGDLVGYRGVDSEGRIYSCDTILPEIESSEGVQLGVWHKSVNSMVYTYSIGVYELTKQITAQLQTKKYFVDEAVAKKLGIKL